jgi:glycosyltransferase involved in cell wall biosynthesis
MPLYYVKATFGGRASVHVILDISRLIGCVRRSAPSGIDRVEMAYARHWLTKPEADCTMAAESAWGGFGALPRRDVVALLDALEGSWTSGQSLARARRIALGLLARLTLGGGRRDLPRRIAAQRRSVFLLVSHRALDRAAPIRRLREAGAAFVPLIHDLIPLTHPEYQRPRQAMRHAARVATTAALADAVIVNSQATAATLRAALPRPVEEILVAPLGIHRLPDAAPSPAATPYFVILGTVEPRKNHILLLHLWRQMAARGEAQMPHLYIVGRRGWENQHVVDLLERCPQLRGHVTDLGPLSDARAAALLAGARALLFPSFAEGYGLPVAEALAARVPVICADLPALREVGGEVPDYLDPLDGPAWARAVLDYARPDSKPRAAQLARLIRWQAPDWAPHFTAVEAMLERVVRPVFQPAGLPGGLLPGPAPLPVAALGAGTPAE